MKFLKLTVICSLLLLSVSSCQEKDIEKTLKHNQEITMTGKVHLVGNAPFGRLALRPTPRIVIYLSFPTKALATQVKQQQGQSITVTGILDIETLTLADKKRTRKQYTIKVIKIK